LKKFKFSLEKVLRQREINAELAQKEFVEAQAELNIQIQKLDAMIEIKNQSIDRRAHLINTSSDWANSVDQLNQFLTGQDVRISKQNERIKEAENLVESRREILRQAVSEVKILERLEEKQRKAYMAEVAKQEQSEIDELTVLRFSRNGNLVKGSHEDEL
jgi:flagellar FliJ protein